MTLQVIIGPMFSGKTTELCRRVQRLRTITDNILVINHSSDKRYGAAADTLSHDKTFKCPSIPVEELSHLYDEPQYIAAEHIFINEAQFFKDLFTFCQISVEKHNKKVSVFGLDGDFRRKPFGDILKLIPIADNITKLSALCSQCGDGTQGLFTKRIVAAKDQVLIGGEDMYQAVCRRHYLKKAQKT